MSLIDETFSLLIVYKYRFNRLSDHLTDFWVDTLFITNNKCFPTTNLNMRNMDLKQTLENADSIHRLYHTLRTTDHISQVSSKIIQENSTSYFTQKHPPSIAKQTPWNNKHRSVFIKTYRLSKKARNGSRQYFMLPFSYVNFDPLCHDRRQSCYGLHADSVMSSWR